MTSEQSFHIHVDNIIPHADKPASQEIFKIWKAAHQFFNEIDYQCVSADGKKLLNVQLKLDLSGPLDMLESAIQRSDSLDSYRQLHAENCDTEISAIIAVKIEASAGTEALNTEDAYYIASTFQQQLFLTLNLAFPGSCKLIGARFVGQNAHLYEAQAFDSKIFYNARMSCHQEAWPALQALDLPTIWNWLNDQGFSRSDTAISNINKVLVNLLKLAQQRHRFGSRSALLASQQFELLLGTGDEAMLRSRTSLILGDIPESADCFVALFKLRNDLITGNHPVRRPALISHSVNDEGCEQISRHNSTIELASSIMINLVQRLIKSGKNKFQFKETLIV
tara:strand:- start:111228 stop:112238 length:1011 start_codon:yes stop_codon:yes gene_type:complete